MTRLAILGLGRSGISAAKAARQAGYEVVALDEKPATDPTIQAAAEELAQAGIEVKLGWHGGLWETGAQTLVTSPGVPKNHPLLQEALRDGMEVISEVELAYRIAKDPIVAVTGTNGKSTTTVMAWLCAQAAGWDAVLCGNIYGSGYEEIPLVEAAASGITGFQPVRTPGFQPGESKSDGSASNRPRALIAEISSFQLEWVSQFKPKAATITNISPDHLNRYDSFEDYADTKRRIFAQMDRGDTAVWRAADYATEPPPGLKTLTFGPHGDDAWADDRRLHLLGDCVDLEELPFRELHNLLNAMAAALLIHGLSDLRADPRELIEGLKRFKGLAHRMERLGERDGVLVVNNSMCTNPAAVIASSRSLPNPQRLLIGGVNKNLDFSPVSDYLRESGHHAYLFGRDANQIASQLQGAWPVFSTMEEAFAAAINDVKPGEAVMLAPGVASMDQFVDFRDRGEAFKRLAMNWLSSAPQDLITATPQHRRPTDGH